MEAYYADPKLMWWNLVFILISTVGWNVILGVVTPLIIVQLVKLGVHEGIQTTINAVNFWIVSFLVMFFSWVSDHTISRFGRRKPYLYVSAPVIIAATVIFPYFAFPRFVALLIFLQIVTLLFMDLKNSTFSLLMYDCMPRPMMARALAAQVVVSAVTGFVASWYADDLIQLGDKVPFLVGGGVMAISTWAACLIKEPPIYHPPTEAFKPWSTFKVSAEDKRVFILMLGVALLAGYIINFNQFQWFWIKETLHFEVGTTLRFTSWVNLVYLLGAYPAGWLIDRVSGLKLTMLAWLVATVCCFVALNTHSLKMLAILMCGNAVFNLLLQAGDLMIIRSCHPKDVGSISATRSFFRNIFQGALVFSTGWIIVWSGHNFRLNFMIGLCLTTVGLALFLVHHHTMKRRPLEQPQVNSPLTVEAPARELAANTAPPA